MKYERNFQDLAYGSLFVVFLVGFYLVQHECVKLAFEGIAATYTWGKQVFFG